MQKERLSAPKQIKHAYFLLFLLAYINSTRVFIVLIPQMNTVYFEQVYLLLAPCPSSPLLQTVSGGFHHVIFKNPNSQYTHTD
jgi:hypothetical protein